MYLCFFFFFSSRRRHTRLVSDLEFRRVLFRSRRDSVRGIPPVVRAPGRAELSDGEARVGIGDTRVRVKPARHAGRYQRSEERRVGKECRSREGRGQEKQRESDEEEEYRRLRLV